MSSRMWACKYENAVVWSASFLKRIVLTNNIKARIENDIQYHASDSL